MSLILTACSTGANPIESQESNKDIEEITELQDASEDIEIKEETKEENEEEKDIEEEEKKEDEIEVVENIEGNIEVHFIDVGHGDSMLIKQNNFSMLIDAGDRGYGDTVASYIRDKGIDKLDYVILTHPHSDHIGGAKEVIAGFEVGKVIMPKVTHTTQVFESLLRTIQSKGLKITTPIVGDVYELGSAKFTILAPNKNSYSNLNNYSVVIKLEYGNNSFVLTGDAEKESENEIVNNGINISADVLKLGHHGSSTSTNENFFKAVNPTYAVIQVGEGNRYNHPDDSVTRKLEENNVKIYRNDLNGNIIAIGNGEDIEFSTTKSIKPSPESTKVSNGSSGNYASVPYEGEEYVGNVNSKIVHKPNCSSLPNENNRSYFKSLEEALNQGYRGCKRCKP